MPNEQFLCYISLNIKGLPAFHRTRLKLRPSQILRLHSFQEEIKASGERIPSTPILDVIKLNINHKRRRKSKHKIS